VSRSRQKRFGSRWTAATRPALASSSLPAACAAAELSDSIPGDKYVPGKALPKDRVPCYDPGNMQYLGDMPAMTPGEVRLGAWARLLLG
jgi:hypothetical protein